MNARRNLKRMLVALFTLGLMLAGSLFVRSARFNSLLTTTGLAETEAPVETITVARGSITFRVETTGALRAASVQSFGGPPAFGEYWQFQIVNMVPEGKNVKKGETLVMFDAQRVNEDLMKYQNQLDQANKELEKTRAQIDLERQELLAKLTDAENKFEKAKLKQRIKSDIEASKNVEIDALAVEQARREFEAMKERVEWQKKSSEATINIITSKKARAENKVAEIRKGMENFQVKADRDGVVVYKTKWNGDKFQVGENVWSGFPLLDIPDLNTIQAEAFVSEVDIGRVKPGQRAEITIDALPGRVLTGQIVKMDKLVRPKAWDIPNKVLSVEIKLDEADASVLRPAMNLKAKIETGVINDCLVVPLKAVKSSAEGATVKVKTETGWRDQAVKPGESNSSEIVILEGLKPGDRIATDFAKVK